MQQLHTFNNCRLVKKEKDLRHHVKQLEEDKEALEGQVAALRAGKNEVQEQLASLLKQTEETKKSHADELR